MGLNDVTRGKSPWLLTDVPPGLRLRDESVSLLKHISLVILHFV